MFIKEIKKEFFERGIFIPFLIYFQFSFLFILGVFLENGIDDDFFNLLLKFNIETLTFLYFPILLIIALFPYSIINALLFPLFIYFNKKIRRKNYRKALSLFTVILIGLYLIALIFNLLFYFFKLQLLSKYSLYPLNLILEQKSVNLVSIYFLGNILFAIPFTIIWNRSFGLKK